MTSATCARITWLLAEGREAYRVRRGLCRYSLPNSTTLDARCLRCGAEVGEHGTGHRRPYTVVIRDRGSRWTNLAAVAIHGGCIPRIGEKIQRGIPARSLRASQVRA